LVLFYENTREFGGETLKSKISTFTSKRHLIEIMFNPTSSDLN
jgi:hypothetical protein